MDQHKLLKEASEALRTLSSEREELKREIESRNEKVANLEMALIAKERSSRSVALANRMLKLGLVTPADLNTKIDEIMKMDDQSYSSLTEMVNSLESSKSEELSLGEADTEEPPVSPIGLDKMASVIASAISKKQV